jgi:hypothetical protein
MRNDIAKAKKVSKRPALKPKPILRIGVSEHAAAGL